MTKKYKRWYDKNEITSRCINLLEELEDPLKRQVSTWLMNEIIEKPPYKDMLPKEIESMVHCEQRRRRWYDYDEVCRIYVELVKNAPDKLQTKICVKSVTYMEDLIEERKALLEQQSK